MWAPEAVEAEEPEKEISEPSRTTSGGVGCTLPFVFVLLIWILLFGFSIEGTHYKFGCDGCAPEVRSE